MRRFLLQLQCHFFRHWSIGPEELEAESHCVRCGATIELVEMWHPYGRDYRWIAVSPAPRPVWLPPPPGARS